MGLLGDRRDRKGRGGLGKERDGWMTCQVDDSHGIRGKLMRHKYVRFWSGTDGGFVGLEFVVFKFLFRVIIRNYRSRGAWFVLSRLLLCRNFFCGEKPTTGSSGAAHGMLMAGLVKIWLRREYEKRERKREEGCRPYAVEKGDGPLPVGCGLRAV